MSTNPILTAEQAAVCVGRTAEQVREAVATGDLAATRGLIDIGHLTNWARGLRAVERVNARVADDRVEVVA